MTDHPVVSTGGGTTVPPPVVFLPETSLMFDRRSKRLAAWADGHPLAEFLVFLSHLCAAQHRAAAQCPAPPSLPADVVAQNLAAAMPLLPRSGSALDPSWRQALQSILDAMAAIALPAAARQVVEVLSTEDAARLEARANAFLLDHAGPDDLATGLFIAAALQIVWSKAAGQLDPALPQPLQPPGLCPVCGSAPISGVVLAAEPFEGLRYLACGLCGTHWHYPRAHCSSCGGDKDIGYLAFDGQDNHARAETCGECRTYVKLFDEAKSPGTEPFADDLASIGLDLRLAEDNWHRAGANPFLRAMPG